MPTSSVAGNGAAVSVVYSNNGSATTSYLVGVTRSSGGVGSFSLKLTQ